MSTNRKINNILDFGIEFQQQLIAEIIVDKKFGLQIIEIIEPQYFKNQYFGFIIKLLKGYHKKHEVIPNYIGIQIEIDMMYSGAPETHKTLTDTLTGIQNAKFENLNVQDIALRFCKYQSVRNAIDEVQQLLNKSTSEDYDKIEDMVKKAVAFKEDGESVNFFTGIEAALDDNYREPIPTGIVGIDEITNGGLGKGELAVIIAPLGVGKTTILSLIGSHAYLQGKNVLHIFFEDTLNEVRRKYLSHWSGIALPDLNANRQAVLDAVARNNGKENQLIFEKLRADEINAVKLRRIIKRERNKLGGKLDMVIVDYADCIVGEQSKDAEEWSGEGRTMRQLEGMADEFQVAFWTAVQGGRKSTTAAVVEVDMIGGNIKKAQVAHLIISIAKTLTQRDQKTATIAILKSRFGDDGKVFDNCTFDNSRMLIDTATMQTFTGFDELQANRVAGRIREVATDYRERHARQQQNAAAHPQ
jgi:replicative DNA helicase